MILQRVLDSTDRRRTPPSRDALRHSGGANLRWTSETETLYLAVELSSDSRPGTEQKTSVVDGGGGNDELKMAADDDDVIAG